MHIHLSSMLIPLFLLLSNHVSSTPGPYPPPIPYSSWMADSMILHGVEPTRWYNEAFFSRAISVLYNATGGGNQTYADFLLAQADGILFPNGSIRGWDYSDHQLDNILVGTLFLTVDRLTAPRASNASKYRIAADFLYDQLVTKQKRTPSGGFWHKDRKYPNQMWLDGLYMAQSFRAQYEARFHPPLFPANAKWGPQAWDDIMLQFDLVEAHCRDPSTDLLYHGYDESLQAAFVANKTTGASAHVWDRAQGWYLMALVDTMDWFPTQHSGYARLESYFVRLAKALKRTQDIETGGWWLVMDGDYPGRTGNYIESSGTAMYTYGLLKGLRKGLLIGEEEEFERVVERAYRGMVERFVNRQHGKRGAGVLFWEGTVRVGSLDGRGDFEYYTSQPVVENSLLGVAPFVLASVEWEEYQRKKGVGTSGEMRV